MGPPLQAMSEWIPVCGSAAGLKYGKVGGLAEIRHSCLKTENLACSEEGAAANRESFEKYHSVI